MLPIVLAAVIVVLFMVISALMFRSSRSRNHEYPAFVPRRQSVTWPLGTQETEYTNVDLKVRRIRSRVADPYTGQTIEEHDEVFVEGPPDAVMYVVERAEQAARNSFQPEYALPPSDPPPALEPPPSFSESSIVLEPNQYEELPESHLHYEYEEISETYPQYEYEELPEAYPQRQFDWERDDQDNASPDW
jgi:hypothetical protein